MLSAAAAAAAALAAAVTETCVRRSVCHRRAVSRQEELGGGSVRYLTQHVVRERDARLHGHRFLGAPCVAAGITLSAPLLL